MKQNHGQLHCPRNTRERVQRRGRATSCQGCPQRPTTNLPARGIGQPLNPQISHLHNTTQHDQAHYLKLQRDADVKLYMNDFDSPQVNLFVCNWEFLSCRAFVLLPDEVGDLFILRLLNGRFIVLLSLTEDFLLDEIDSCYITPVSIHSS